MRRRSCSRLFFSSGESICVSMTSVSSPAGTIICLYAAKFDGESPRFTFINSALEMSYFRERPSSVSVGVTVCTMTPLVGVLSALMTLLRLTSEREELEGEEEGEKKASKFPSGFVVASGNIAVVTVRLDSASLVIKRNFFSCSDAISEDTWLVRVQPGESRLNCLQHSQNELCWPSMNLPG